MTNKQAVERVAFGNLMFRHMIDWLKKAKSHGAHGNMMLVDNTPLSVACYPPSKPSPSC